MNENKHFEEYSIYWQLPQQNNLVLWMLKQSWYKQFKYSKIMKFGNYKFQRPISKTFGWCNAFCCILGCRIWGMSLDIYQDQDGENGIMVITSHPHPPSILQAKLPLFIPCTPSIRCIPTTTRMLWVHYSIIFKSIDMIKEFKR